MTGSYVEVAPGVAERFLVRSKTLLLRPLSFTTVPPFPAFALKRAFQIQQY